MATCKECGKKGLFLKVNAKTGLCSGCNEKYLSKLHNYGLDIVENAFKPNIPEFAKDGYEKHLNEKEEFAQGNHNIFRDNDLSEQEIIFFKVVYAKVEEIAKNPALLKLNRLSDKTINVQYIDMQIGRIKLQGRKTKMQLLTNNDVIWIDNESFEFYLQNVDKWMQYLKKVSRKK